MSDNPQIIDEILARLYHDGRMLPYSYDMEHEVINQAKQAIKEAILTEVIGNDPRWLEGGATLPKTGDEYNKDIVRAKVRAEQRQRLDAWLGLEDTSSNA